MGTQRLSAGCKTKGPDTMMEYCEAMLQRLPVRWKLKYIQAVTWFIQEIGVFRWVDACAGTSLISNVLGTLFKFFQDAWSLSIHSVHVAAIEKVPFKRDFIAKHSNPKMMFVDVRQMQDAAAYEIFSGSSRDTPRHFEFLVAGFECDNYSAFNMHRDGPGSLANDRGKSGQSGVGVVNFIESAHPRFFLLENVKGLAHKNKQDPDGKSDLRLLAELVNKMGYYLSDHTLDTLQYGVPMTRNRFYLVGMSCGRGPIDQFEEGFMEPEWVGRLQMWLELFQSQSDSEMMPLVRAASRRMMSLARAILIAFTPSSLVSVLGSVQGWCFP